VHDAAQEFGVPAHHLQPALWQPAHVTCAAQPPQFGAGVTQLPVATHTLLEHQTQPPVPLQAVQLFCAPQFTLTGHCVAAPNDPQLPWSAHLGWPLHQSQPYDLHLSRPEAVRSAQVEQLLIGLAQPPDTLQVAGVPAHQSQSGLLLHSEQLVMSWQLVVQAF